MNAFNMLQPHCQRCSTGAIFKSPGTQALARSKAWRPTLYSPYLTGLHVWMCPLPQSLTYAHISPPSHQLKHCGVAHLLHINILRQLQKPSCPTATTVQPPRYFAVACIPLQVRFFGSPRDAGSGLLKSLVAAIKAGSIDAVYLLTRWNGHGTTQQVRKLCKAVLCTARDHRNLMRHAF
jgi:hypothetical protein